MPDAPDRARLARVVVLAPMPSELAPVVRRLGLQKESRGADTVHTGTVGRASVRAYQTGVGTANAAATTERALAAGDVDRVVVVGIAGAVDPALAIGDLMVPDVVVDGDTWAEYKPAPLGPGGASVVAGKLHTSDRFIVDPEGIAELRRRGVTAVDMETAAVGAVCERLGVTWSVFRSISDKAYDGSMPPEIVTLMNPDGSPNRRALKRYLGRRPWRIFGLMKAARGSRRASEVAAAAVAAACVDMPLPEAP
jgi:adenosylhomocysteine nucleosidase